MPSVRSGPGMDEHAARLRWTRAGLPGLIRSSCRAMAGRATKRSVRCRGNCMPMLWRKPIVLNTAAMVFQTRLHPACAPQLSFEQQYCNTRPQHGQSAWQGYKHAFSVRLCHRHGSAESDAAHCGTTPHLHSRLPGFTRLHALDVLRALAGKGVICPPGSAWLRRPASAWR